MRLVLLAAFAALLVSAPAVARADDEPPRGARLVREDGQGEPYTLTRDDAVWAARMLVGEAGGEDDADNRAVLFCMINSYMMRPVRKDYPTFAAFIRAYCTPLQPWLRSKGPVERHRKLGTPMVEIEPGKWQLVRHVELQKREWAKLPASARAVVARVFTGLEKSPCGNATQFCSTAVYFKDKHGRRPSAEEHETYTREYAKSKKWRWVKVEGSNPRANCFFLEERFATLPDRLVRVEPPAP